MLGKFDQMVIVKGVFSDDMFHRSEIVQARQHRVTGKEGSEPTI